jgi:acyl transferase domain-containing protein/acyl carrier protein
LRETKPPLDLHQLLKRSLVKIESLEADLARLREAAREPIAIVGLGCRFPGADGPEAFWELLAAGRDAVTERPAGRWPLAAGQASAEPPGARWGGFIEGVEQFDAGFFEISPREALHLDPRQRLVLEAAWEALEHAGLAPDRLQGSSTGVFVAASGLDYYQMVSSRELGEIDGYVTTGNGLCFIAGRLSYVLGLQGPSLAVDTACSGSLVAVHLACQSLRQGQCRQALAGGVNLVLSPLGTYALAQTQALSPEGRCRTFDARANGFVRGEGCGIIVLKRLADALADGDSIQALIRGSAVNQDGRSTGFTAPNVLAQENLLREALADAGVAAEQITAIEAHGTGTSLGDPIEVTALKAVFRVRQDGSTCALGSVKTNLGHLESAAGIAGLIKMVLALDRQLIPRHLHFETLSPRISLDDSPFVIPTRATPWRRGPAPRLAGVSSFGLSGTSAHMVLEEAPAREAAAAGVERPRHLLTLSAKSDAALRAQAARYAEHLGAAPAAPLPDVAFTANTGRAHFAHRLAVPAEDPEALRKALAAFAAGAAPPGLVHDRARRGARPLVAFLFTGQGSQYPGMGARLDATQPVFREALERCAVLLEPQLDKPLREVLYPAAGKSSPIDQTLYTQPALFALEYALVELWRSWGVEPDAVLGHSVGEYTAAWAAGALSLGDALSLVARRASLMHRTLEPGEMAAVAAGEQRVVEAIAAYDGQVSIAAINGAESTVISGASQPLSRAAAELAAAGFKVERLRVSHAFHSPLVEPILDELERYAAAVVHARPRCEWVSNLSGRPFAAGEAPDAAYWRRHCREPVRFHDGLQALLGKGYEIFVEIGPAPALSALGRRSSRSQSTLWLPSLRRGRDDWQQLLSSLGALYVRGVEIDWAGFDRPYPRRKVALPTYPFQRQRYWLDYRGEPGGARHLPVAAGERPRDWLYEIRWRLKPLAADAESAAPTAAMESPEPSLWLILADQGPAAQGLAERLRAAGDRCALVVRGENWGIEGDGRYRIDPTRPEDYRRLVQEAETREGLPCHGVLHLWSLDSSSPEAITLESLDRDQELGCRPALYLLQALAAAPRPRQPRLWLITRGVQPVAPRPPVLAVNQSALWGLGKVIAREHPELWGGLVDLGAGDSEQDLAELVRELRGGDGEDRLAWRDGQRHVARLVRTEIDPEADPAALLSLRADVTYLIVGGLGGVGMSAAKGLVEAGARHLVLVGRSGPSEAAREPLRQLEELGARVLVESADVTVREDVAGLLERIAVSAPPLRGVIHSAMISNDKVLFQHDWQRFTEVMAPKVAGTWILHELTRDLPLDFFVMFSSAAALVGIAGLGNYTAANTFQDAFAHYRRRLGLPAMSVNWGGWQRIGVARDLGERRERQWQANGIHTFSEEQGVEALELLMARDFTQVGVLRIDWPRYLEQFAHPGEALYLSELPMVAAAAAAAAPAAGPDLRRRLREALPGERRGILGREVVVQAARALGIDPGLPVDPGQPLSELGLDSLMAVELRNSLGKALGATLPATVIFDHPSPEALTDYLARQVLDLESTARPAARPASAFAGDEPIAIVGMACRLPGGIHDPQGFWELLRSGADVMGELPAGRWDAAAYHDPDPEAAGKAYVHRGGFVAGIELFDASFFGISPREAASMDPNQRLLLEVSWEALERAGQAPERLAGSRTGVFFGVYPSEYSELALAARGDAGIDAYFVTGNSLSIAAGRLSYLLGLEGPSMVVDTACSASLVATHLASQSLRQGECDLALAGGVHLILSPQLHVGMCKLRMLAPDGRCKAFDAAADGFSRGEGCGVVVLERLADARANGHPVLALVRGSAVNQDGRSSGLTAPNGRSQAAVVRRALERAGVAPREVAYVEAHGTGTALGDPIEAGALIEVLGEGRGEDEALIVGSVKTNIGHLEAAAGVAGLIKAVLALEHGEIPPNLHFEKLSPHITPAGFPFVVPTRVLPWPVDKTRRIAAVSSFGFSGTNAHVVLEQAPEMPAPAASPVEGSCGRPWHLLALSARSAPALERLAGRFAAHLADAGAELADVAFSANTGRNHFEHRLALVAASTDQARGQLAAFVDGAAPAGLASGSTDDRRPPKVAMLFTGQGSQYVGMGRQLASTQPVFRRALETCDELLRPHLERPLLSVLYPEQGMASPLDQAAYAQPALFALQYALVEMLRSWGLEPGAVFGHGVGELAAACTAGVLELEDALGLVARRGRLMQDLPPGRMAVVFAGEQQVAETLARHRGQLAIAAVNGPRNTVLSGAAEALDEVLAELRAAGVGARSLEISHGFHSPLVEPALAALEQAAARAAHRQPRIPLIAGLDGRLHREAGFFDATYWRRQARQPVRFQAAVETLLEAGYRIFVEIGPEPALATMARAFVGREDGLWLPSLRRKRPDWEQLLDSLAALYVKGLRIDWQGLDRGTPRRRVRLPTYPFERQRHWLESAAGRRVPAPGSAASEPDGARHPLLGRRLRTPLRQIQFESHLDAGHPSFLDDHRVHDVPVVPATAYFEMALTAGCELFGKSPRGLAEVVLQEPLVLAGGRRIVQLVVEPGGNGAAAFQVLSAAEGEDGPWTTHAAGSLVAHSKRANGEPPPLAELRRRCGEPLEVAELYRRLRGRGIEHGESFRGVERLWRGDAEALGRVRLPAVISAEADRYGSVHPVLLDICLQIAELVLPDQAGEVTYLPFRLDRLHLERALPAVVWSHVRMRNGTSPSAATPAVDVRIYDDAGELVVELGLELRAASREAVPTATAERPEQWLYRVRWRALPLSRQGSPAIGSPDPPLAERLPALIEEHGLGAHRELGPRLEQLSFAYLTRALRRLGWDHPPGRRLALDTLAAQLGVVADHHRLLGRLLEILAEEGVVRRCENGWEVTAALPVEVDPGSFCRELRERYPAGEAQLDLLGRCGEQLAEVLSGRRSPLELLFPAGEKSLEALYFHSPLVRTLNALVRQAVGAAFSGWPAGRKVRFLEVGAGSGGTTASLLPQLPEERTDYLFTDISPLFLAQAAKRFAAYPCVRYEVLDLERDPGDQGLRPGSFDAVVAANVLHATSDLRRTLGYLRRLLVPGGLLALIEIVGAERWVDLTFGLTKGWWTFADADLRPAYPLLSRPRWLRLLGEVGFERQEAVPADGELDLELCHQAIFLARAAIAAGEGAAAAGAGRWVIVADRGGVGEHLAAELRRGGGEALVIAAAGEATAPATAGCRQVSADQPGELRGCLRQALAESPPERGVDGVVYLWGLDAAPPAAGTAESLAADQARVCGGALEVVQALAAAGQAEPPRLWLMTRGAQSVGDETAAPAISQATLWGLAKVVALEHPQLRCTCVDLDPAEPAVAELLAELRSGDRETQVAWRGGDRKAARLERLEPSSAAASGAATAPCYLPPPAHGLLEELRFEPRERQSPRPGEVEVEVAATGLNFRDLLCALGGYPGEVTSLGGDFAGTVVSLGEGVAGLRVGQRVAGLARGAFASFVTTPAELMVPVPERLSLAEAASLPTVYLTAHYALDHLARLRAGERVLIHAATGGVGLAAVRLAQRAGAQVFATAGNPRKRELLRSLGIEHVFDSRSLAFAGEILRQTGGRGVDVVLNSLAGQFIAGGFSVLAPGGRFLEIGKRGIWTPEDAARERPDARYFPIDLDAVAFGDPAFAGGLLRHLVREIEAGELEPLPLRTFALDEVVAAFRHMQQAQHIGKIVVEHPHPAAGEALRLRGDRSYLITGGLRGLGLLVAERLVERGARHLLLAGRGEPTAAAAATLEALRRRGAVVEVARADVSRPEDVGRLLARVDGGLPPLAGVVHAAGVLDDGVLAEQSRERFRTVMAPKVAGGWLLHTATASRQLDFFVLFSSMAAMLGSPGQGNHAAANAFLDALAAYRRHLGLPAQSINWGPWSEVGAAARRDLGDRHRRQGVGVISPRQGLDLLERLMCGDTAQAGVLPVDWGQYLGQFPAGSEPPLLAGLAPRARSAIGPRELPRRDSGSFREELRRTPAARRRALLRKLLLQETCNVLGLSAEELNPRQPLTDLGLDSLMAVELRNALGLLCGVTLPATLIFDHPTVEALGDHLAGSVLRLEATAAAAPAAAEPDAIARQVAELSKEDLLGLLAAELDSEATP